MTKRKWLRRAGLIVGLAGAIELAFYALFYLKEGGFSWNIGWYLAPSLAVVVIPFSVGVLIAWKWPLVGGIVLIVIALSWLIFIVVIPFSTPINQLIRPLLLSRFKLALPLALPPLAVGILFLLYWRAERAYLVRKRS